MATVTLDNYLEDVAHSVGTVQLSGFLSEQHVVNFLNIPYANAPIRFGPPQLLPLYDLHTPYDATRYGPRCPQEASAFHLAMSHLYKRMSLVEQLPDETKCLNLNIYAPASTLGTGKLPVFVWIHGGAFNVGDNTVQFDGNYLVKKSMDIDQPVLIVTMNYRLNLFGSLWSRELNEEAEVLEELPVRNQGLHDQRTALKWIQLYIHHFGGDPNKVTLCGESAGAYSILCHLKGGIPLFRQAMIQSPPFPPLRTPQEAQVAFDKLVVLAGSTLEASSTDKLAALRSLSTQQLMDLFDGAFCIPIEDPNWFIGYDRASTDLTNYWADLPCWCSRVIFGNTQDESALMLADIHNLTPEQAVELAQIVTPYASDTAIPMVKSHTKRELIAWSSHQAFISPLMRLASAAVAQSPQIQLYGYQICSPDPFPGPLQGYAWHSYGIPFTFNQPACRAYPELTAMQDSMTSAFLRFLHGHEPWEAFNNTRRVMRWSYSRGEMASSELFLL